MEILQLRYFCNAAETGNFSRTAENFNVPSSDISQSIKRLEKELDTQLFTRFANKVELNEAGQSFANKISHALQLIDSAKNELSGATQPSTLRICITTNRRIVMEVIEKFRVQHPETVFVISHTLPEKGENYHLIIADDDFTLGNEIKGKYKRELIVSEEILLAVNKNHPFALSQKQIKASELKHEGFVTMFTGSSLHRTLLKTSELYGFTPKIVIQSDDPFYVRKCVELGLGIAVVPGFSWQGQFSKDVVLKKFGGGIRNTYAYYQVAQLSGDLRAFVRELVSFCGLNSAKNGSFTL